VSALGVGPQPPKPAVRRRHPHGFGHECGKYLSVFDPVEGRRACLIQRARGDWLDPEQPPFGCFGDGTDWLLLAERGLIVDENGFVR
jgi:hypothetical protein